MKVACVQQRAQGIESYREIFGNLKELIIEAAENQADLIVLPECAYPAYFLGMNEKACEEALAESDAFLEKIAGLAGQYQVHIAVGAAVREGEALYNAAYLFDDSGKLVHKTSKSNMWHFDSKWFTPEEEFAAFDTKFGKMGMLVCADGRVPEIARILALQGAKVIIDTVNLVAAAADTKALMNQQYEFILPVRAMENQTWFLVSDKAGLEAKTAGYLGRSMIIDPDGRIVSDASTDKQEIIYYDIDMNREQKELPPRRPELYGELVKETKELDVYDVMKRPVETISDMEIFISTAAFQADTLDEYVEKAGHYIKACEIMGTKILCLPQLLAENDIHELADRLSAELKGDLLLVAGGKLDGYKGALVFDKSKVYGTYYKTHGEGNKADAALSVAETPFGRIAVLFDEEPYIQELPRVYMLKGCDILVWSDCMTRAMDTKVMQTRGAENKIFVIRTSSAKGDTSSAVNPDGKPVTSTFRGEDQAASGLIFLPAARAKTVVPGTNVVLGRIPKAYGRLIE